VRNSSDYAAGKLCAQGCVRTSSNDAKITEIIMAASSTGKHHACIKSEAHSKGEADG
jgi:hypothetical protein